MVASLVAASSRNNYVFAKISELTTSRRATKKRAISIQRKTTSFRSAPLLSSGTRTRSGVGEVEKRVAFSKASNESIAR